MIPILHRLFHVWRRKKDHVRLEPALHAQGTVAISYIIWPFLEGVDSPKMRGHTNAHEVVTMAEVFLKMGYAVEVTDWQNRSYLPPADCVLAIDIDANLERWAPTLPSGCGKIFHATGPHWLESNIAELTRINAIRQRKGTSLIPRRQVGANHGCEIADHILVLGNEYTINSYSCGKVPVTRVPISSAYEFAWPEGRDFESARKNFLWVSSYGMAWKGLDLALDAFKGMPGLNLTVCGRPEKEQDFFEMYRDELLNAPNIKLLGWIDFASPDFAELARTHACVVQFASSEGGGGSAIHCMHAGLLPVCTRETSVDLMDFGVYVESPDISSIQETCRSVSTLPVSELERRARAAYDHVRRVHTRTAFAENYKRFAESQLPVLNELNIEG